MSLLKVSEITDLTGAGSTYMPGHVVQVVQVVKTDQFVSTSTVYEDVTGIAATITPKSSSSKILVIIQANVSSLANTLSDGAHFRISGGNSSTYIGNAAGSREQSTYTFNQLANGATLMIPMNITYLDSPSTASSVTYKLQCRRASATNVVVNRTAADSDNANFPRSPSSITLMEIAQ